MADVFLNRYESSGFIGQGSMGKVWLAHPVGQPDRDVVVKVMHQHVAEQSRSHQLIKQEIQSLNRLCHPYIVKLLESSHDPRHGLCLVMEYIPGITLETLLMRKCQLTVGHVGLLLGYLCHALEAAHAIGVIHRDLKPANLMIVGDGSLDESLRVMDFGLAQISSKPHFTQERLTGADITTIQGTPTYMCPEQLRGDEVDVRSDIYSVGVVLFEMLTGQLPFPYHDIDLILHAHVFEKPLSFAQVGVHDLPPAVERVVQQCLLKFAVERFGSVRELARQYSQAIDIDICEATQPEMAEAEALPKSVYEPDRNAIVHQIEAWMPERIAVVKLQGFLENTGGKVVQSEPGLLRIRLGSAKPLKQGRPSLENRAGNQPIEIEMHMVKLDPRQNHLNITVLFRPFTDAWLLQAADWIKRCDVLYKDLQSYLMAR